MPPASNITADCNQSGLKPALSVKFKNQGRLLFVTQRGGFPQTAARSNKSTLIYLFIPFDWLHGCKYSAGKYTVLLTECVLQAPPCCPVGLELRCHSQLFIRLHIHSLSITVLPPGPVTSLYVYYSVPPSWGGWLTCGEKSEVGLALCVFSNHGSRGGGFFFSIHTLIMSQ